MAVSFLSRFMYYIINYRKMQEFFRGFFNFIYFFWSKSFCAVIEGNYHICFVKRKLRLRFCANGVRLIIRRIV